MCPSMFFKLKLIRFILFTLLFWWLMPLSWAVPVATLYQGEVPVASHSASDWQKALSPALQQVLIKVSGNASVKQNPVITKALSRAEGFVQSYNYADASSGKSMTLQVRFTPKLINELLTQAGQTILSKDRPLTIVWLAEQKTPHAPWTVLNDSNYPPVFALQKEAEKLGIPLMFPSMDLQDMSLLDGNKIGTLDQQAAIKASQRYPADGIVIGKLTQTSSNNWQGQWLLLAGEASQSWQTQGNTDITASLNMLTHLGKSIAAAPVNKIRQSSNNSASHSMGTTTPKVSMDVTLRVSGIQGTEDYASLIDYIRSLNLVKSSGILQTQAHEVWVRVKILGSPQQLMQAIESHHRLTPTPDARGQYYYPSSTMMPPVIHYRWLNDSINQELPLQNTRSTTNPLIPQEVMP